MATITDGAAPRSALQAQERHLETLDALSQRFGKSLSDALASGASGGRELAGVLDGVSGRMTSLLGRSLGSSLSSGLAGALQAAVRSLSGAATLSSFGDGLTPFAQGGIVAAPTYFPLAGGLGLMGEAGAEAIMPLSRGADGRLGVQAAGPGATTVTVNIAAQDVESFRRSEAQVAAALARAVARGRRAL